MPRPPRWGSTCAGPDSPGCPGRCPRGWDEQALEALLFPPTAPSGVPRPLPDWAQVHVELKAKGVTLALLWQEYKTAFPEGLQYSHFCEHYRVWARRLDVVMRQSHRAGEKLFVDYAGQTVPVVDRQTGECRTAQIFVAVLGASNFTFAEATWTQTLPDWTASHVRALRYLGGAPELFVPDNLRSGVARTHRYEPDLNPTYQDLAEHYGVAILPARVRRPRGRVEMWRGGSRSGLSVSAPFVRRCLNSRTVTPFPHPSRRTGRADLPHPALIPSFMPSRSADDVEAR